MNPSPPAPPLVRDLPPSINPKKTHVVRTFTIDDVPLTTCRIDPAGRYVVAAAENFHIYRWPLAGPQSARTVLHGHNSWVRSIRVSSKRAKREAGEGEGENMVSRIMRLRKEMGSSCSTNLEQKYAPDLFHIAI